MPSMLLCLAIPAWSLVGTMRGHRAVSVSLCLMCHCQKHSTGSGFCRRAMGRRELAAELRVLPIIGVSAPPGTLSFHRAALGIWHQCCRSWAVLQQCLSFPLCLLADPVLSTAILQTDVWFCRGDFEAVLLAAKHSTNCLQLPHPLQPPVSSPQSSRRDVRSYPQWMCSSCGMQCCPTHRSPHFLCSSCSG